MPVRLGEIELRSVQNVRADDNRTLVELRVPGQSGSVFQDLGRAPASVVLEGLLIGEGAEPTLEKLRSAYLGGSVLSFASDIAIGTELTDVVIADLLVRQEAGHRDRYRYTIKVREHVEPPESLSAAQAGVDAAAAGDAASWSADAVAAGDALADPAGLAGALDANPGLLDHLSAAELGDALGANLDAIEGGALGDIMDRVSSLDPSKAGDMLDRLKSTGKLGGFLEKLVSVGRTILEVARKVGGILASVGAIMDLIEAVKRVGAAAKKIWDDAGAFVSTWGQAEVWRVPDDDGAPVRVPEPTPRVVFADVTGLVAAVADLVGQEILRKLRDLAAEYGLGGVIDTVARALITGVEYVQRVLEVIKRAAGYVSGLGAVLQIGAGFEEVVDSVSDMVDDAAEASARAVFRALEWAAALVGALPGVRDVTDQDAAFEALKRAFRHYTLGDVPLPAQVPAAQPAPGAA